LSDINGGTDAEEIVRMHVERWNNNNTSMRRMLEPTCCMSVIQGSEKHTSNSFFPNNLKGWAEVDALLQKERSAFQTDCNTIYQELQLAKLLQFGDARSLSHHIHERLQSVPDARVTFVYSALHIWLLKSRTAGAWAVNRGGANLINQLLCRFIDDCFNDCLSDPRMKMQRGEIVLETTTSICSQEESGSERDKKADAVLTCKKPPSWSLTSSPDPELLQYRR
jgi:hypothetical protein